jgi:hypothetical protein
MAVTVMPVDNRWGSVSPGRVPSQLQMTLTGVVFLIVFAGLCAAAFLKEQRHMLLGASLFYLAPMLEPDGLGELFFWNPFYGLMIHMGHAWVRFLHEPTKPAKRENRKPEKRKAPSVTRTSRPQKSRAERAAPACSPERAITSGQGAARSRRSGMQMERTPPTTVTLATWLKLSLARVKRRNHACPMSPLAKPSILTESRWRSSGKCPKEEA